MDDAGKLPKPITIGTGLRDNEATAHGYAVLRFTYEMLRDRRQECLATLLRTGRVRSAS